MGDEYDAAADLENTLSRWDGDDEEEAAYAADEDDGDRPQNKLEEVEEDIREIQYYIMISTDYYETRDAEEAKKAKLTLHGMPKNGGAGHEDDKSLIHAINMYLDSKKSSIVSMDVSKTVSTVASGITSGVTSGVTSVVDGITGKASTNQQSTLIDSKFACNTKDLDDILAKLLEHTKANRNWACNYIWNDDRRVKEVIAAYLLYLKYRKKKEKAKNIRMQMMKDPSQIIADKDMEVSAQEVYYTCLSIKRKKKKSDAMKQDAYHYSVIKEACERHSENMGVVEDDDNDDSTEARILCLTKPEEYEFKVAFSVVAGVDEISYFNKMHIGQIEEVFLALGLTLQTFDLKKIVNNIELDSYDECTCEQLKDAYEVWRRHQIPVSMLKALFNKILKDTKLPQEGAFPVEFKTLNHGTLSLDPQSICNAINKIQDLSGNNRLKSADIMTTISELKSSKDSGVTFRDFVNIFASDEKYHV